MGPELELVSVMATIRLLSAAEGGRTSAIRGSFRPNHDFGLENGAMSIGIVELPADTELRPGESIDVPVSFWYWPGLAGQIHKGRVWRINEGAKVIGTGTVLEVLPPADAA